MYFWNFKMLGPERILENMIPGEGNGNPLQ